MQLKSVFVQAAEKTVCSAGIVPIIAELMNGLGELSSDDDDVDDDDDDDDDGDEPLLDLL